MNIINNFKKIIHKGDVFLDNRQFFNPYGMPGAFNMTGGPNSIIPPSGNIPGMNNELFPLITLKDFYEGQYMYYRYLTQMLDYTIKSKEYEKTRNDTSKKEV